MKSFVLEQRENYRLRDYHYFLVGHRRQNLARPSSKLHQYSV